MALDDHGVLVDIEGVMIDGSYVGSGKGYNGKIKVEVQIEKTQIIGLKVVETTDDDPYIEDAIQGIFEAVMLEQTSEVDTVTGATYSSQGIIKAIADAMNQATTIEE